MMLRIFKEAPWATALTPQPTLLELGKAKVVRHGGNGAPRVALFGLGNMCAVEVEAADLPEREGISATVVNPRWIKLMDTGSLEFFARSVEVVCTLGEYVSANDYDSAVTDYLSEARITTPVFRLGWPGKFIESRTVSILRESTV